MPAVSSSRQHYSLQNYIRKQILLPLSPYNMIKIKLGTKTQTEINIIPIYDDGLLPRLASKYSGCIHHIKKPHIKTFRCIFYTLKYESEYVAILS